MNIYKKYCPNVFIAECTEEYSKGDQILVTTKYGKENECIIHNFIGYAGTKEDPRYCYSITRADGYNSQERATQKIEKLNEWADNAEKRGVAWEKKSREGSEFLALGEPIKIGHHSEKKHRALLERNWTRMDNAMEEFKKAEAYKARISYWENLAKKIDLSMPESLDFYKIQLEEAIEYHKVLKNGSIEREHAYSLTYANKRVKDLKSKYETAIKLWGEGE